MSLFFLIAFRNLFRHKGKTAVIAVILFLGAFLLTIGSGVIGGLNYGLQKNLVESFTGDVIILSDQQHSEAIFGGNSAQTLAPITNYPHVKTALTNADCVSTFLPMGIGYVWVLHNTGQPIEHYIIGVNFDAYKTFFSSHLKILQGQYPSSNSRGLLMSSYARNYIYEYSGNWHVPPGIAPTKKHPQIKNDIVFLGLSDKNSNLDIRTEVTGIFRYPSLNKILGYFSLIDIESYRECMGFFNTTIKTEPLSKIQEKTLTSENPETLFETDILTTEQSTKTSELISKLNTLSKKSAPTLQNIPNWEEGAFNVILIRLKNGISPNEGVEKLTTYFKKNNLPLKAVSWSKAIGMVGQLAVIMKSALYIFVGFIFFVAAMIIMNTLSMAAMERTAEIGMMRAVGAKKRFISGMFVVETFILAIIFGGSGVLFGGICIKLLSSLKLKTKNEILQILYGGDIFHPMLSLKDFTLCFFTLIIVTLIAVIYPLYIARGITPLDAVSRD